MTDPSAEAREAIRSLVWRYLHENRHLEPTVDDIMGVVTRALAEKDAALAEARRERDEQESEDGLTIHMQRDALAEMERERDVASRVLARLGLVRHAGTWITREEADRISKDGP